MPKRRLRRPRRKQPRHPRGSAKSRGEKENRQGRCIQEGRTEEIQPSPAKPKSGGLFGAKKPKKTYEGEPGGKAEWFLEEALDTVYDPHGTGKTVKAAMILARSSEGNVRYVM